VTMSEDDASHYNVEIQHQRPGWVTEESKVSIHRAIEKAMAIKRHAQHGVIPGDVITGIRITKVNVIAEWEVRR